MERQWLRNLADSEYGDGTWHLADPNSPSYLAHTQVQNIVDTLFTQTRDAIDIFNGHADDRKQMRLFKMTRKSGTKPCGLAIMLKSMQVKLEQHGHKLRSEAVMTRGYKTTRTPLRVFSPRFDTFGKVMWLVDEKYIVDHPRITQLLLEDTLKLAYKHGLIPSVPLDPQPRS